jgi:YhcN/YlaJ family sporulation lipoprotein
MMNLERMMIVRVFIVLATLAVLVSACSKANNGASSPNNNHQVHVQQSTPAKPQINNPSEVINRLEKLAKAVPHVNDAHCVVIGHTAIVGINVDGNLDRARVGTIKYSVAEALRRDPVGIHAIVTADIDISNRLREMSTDIQKGKPISGFTQELADIFGRIIPQLPRDVAPPEDNQANRPTSKDSR